MATKKELNDYYKTIYKKDFPSSTLSKWVATNRIKATKNLNGYYDYDLQSFIDQIQGAEYQKRIKAKKEKPVDYIGKVCGKLLVKSIVPEIEKKRKI